MQVFIKPLVILRPLTSYCPKQVTEPSPESLWSGEGLDKGINTKRHDSLVAIHGTVHPEGGKTSVFDDSDLT